MTQDEINKMVYEFLPYLSEGQHNALKQFAKLVADVATAKEREACANLMFDLDLCAHEGKAADAIRARGNKE